MSGGPKILNSSEELIELLIAAGLGLIILRSLMELMLV
jgi:hypothetical protein